MKPENKNRQPSYQALIRAGAETAAKMPELLLLLAGLSGALTTILGYQGINAWASLGPLLGEVPDGRPESMEAFLSAFKAVVPALLFFQIISTLLLALVLIPWIRSIFYGKQAALEGGAAALLRRGARGFTHLIFALGLGLAATSVITLLVGQIGGALGPLGFILTLIAVGAGIWLMAALTAAAHLALFQEAIDLPVSLFDMVARLKPALAALTNSYLILYLTVTLLASIISGILTAPLPSGVATALQSMMSGAASYIISAIFIAGAIRTSLFHDVS